MDNNLICAQCGNEIEGEHIELNEQAYCFECKGNCDNCGYVKDRDDLVSNSSGSQMLCETCHFSCEHCGDIESTQDLYDVDGSSWCVGCYENNTFYCDYCESSYPENYDSNYVQGRTACDSCYSEYCYYCDSCGESYEYDDPCGCDDDEREGRESNRSIHEYSYKPDPIFIGKNKHNLFMGFELEMELGSSSNTRESADYASPRLEGVAYLKQDSSISRNGSDGFELVTHPHTLVAYQDRSHTLWDTIDTLRDTYNGRSWDTETCGLHIHISRAGFNGGAHTHRFIAFIYKNAPEMIKLAGRKSDFARFNDVYAFDEYDRPIFSLKHKLDRNMRSERYSAVNTQNASTLELRFFRGTMKPSGILSALELTEAVAEYTRDLRLSDVKLGALSWEWFCDYVSANNGLYPNLYQRLDKLGNVDINKREKLNA